MEIWRDIEGFNGMYQVSNIGNVRSKYSGNRKGIAREYHNLKMQETKTGYSKVFLGRKNKLVHRLVAMAFIPNPQNKPQVNHINGNKKDNRAKNLEWVSCRENIIHSVKTGLTFRRGIRMYNPKTNESFDFILREDIEKYFNRKICQDVITRCCNKKRKTAYGMVWNYILEK